MLWCNLTPFPLVSCYLGKETDAHLYTTSFQVTVLSVGTTRAGRVLKANLICKFPKTDLITCPELNLVTSLQDDGAVSAVITPKSQHWATLLFQLKKTGHIPMAFALTPKHWTRKLFHKGLSSQEGGRMLSPLYRWDKQITVCCKIKHMFPFLLSVRNLRKVYNMIWTTPRQLEDHRAHAVEFAGPQTFLRSYSWSLLVEQTALCYIL